MSCFVVPMAEAIATTVVTAVLERKAKKAIANGDVEFANKQLNTAKKVKVLNRMLWGGVGMLAFEHVWHGEISPAFPFLTAATQGAGALAQVGLEMATVGVGMAALVTLVWGGIMLVSRIKNRKALKSQTEV